jgi:hypothetical protein
MIEVLGLERALELVEGRLVDVLLAEVPVLLREWLDILVEYLLVFHGRVLIALVIRRLEPAQFRLEGSGPGPGLVREIDPRVGRLERGIMHFPIHLNNN